MNNSVKHLTTSGLFPCSELEIAHVGSFSGGGGSWAAMKRLAAEVSVQQITLLFSDTIIEDQDTYRFVIEGAANVFGSPRPTQMLAAAMGLPELSIDDPHCLARKEKLAALRMAAMKAVPGLVWIAEGRHPWEVFEDRRFIGNSLTDPCSEVLKRELLDAWRDRHCRADSTICYVGLDWSEKHRLNRMLPLVAPWLYEAPLCDPPLLTKPAVLDWMREEGIEPPRAYALGFPHNNCFSGETPVPTTDGIFTLRELDGRTVTVLTSVGMREGVGRSFGVQPLRRVVLSRSGRSRVVEATPNHRWYVEDDRRTKRWEVYTDGLRPGDIMATFDSDPDQCELVRDDVARGIVYGDGTRCGNTSTWVILCGSKTALAQWMPAGHSSTEHEAGRRIGCLPATWKDKPVEVHWPSWLAGYFAADGSLTRQSCGISTADPNDIDLIRYAAFMAGVPVTGVTSYEREGFGVVSTMHEVGLRLPRHLVLRDEHLQHWAAPQYALRRWKVVSVEDTGRQEKVYCLTVPGPHDMSLLDGLGTGQCGGFCCKAGQAHFALLYRKLPGRFAWHEWWENRLREIVGDYSMMSDRRGDGVKKPLTLSALRQRIEAGEDFSREEWGGCGCALPNGSLVKGN